MKPSHMIGLVWPSGEPGLRLRVLVALVLIGVAKGVAVTVPLLYKQILDSLSAPGPVAVPLALVAAYGIVQLGGQAAQALRQLVFVHVAKRAVRVAAVRAFRHVHSLSLRFHLDRQTGGLSRILERGTHAVEFLLDLMLFSILPTLLELLLVAGILWHLYDARFALVTIATVLLYGAATIVFARWQVAARRDMNRLDVAASMRGVDSILNYETVKYFAAEDREIAAFDAAKAVHERAAIRHAGVEAGLTVAQAALIALGTVIVMALAGREVAAGAMTLGDFVLVNTYLLQLFAPLGVLGMVYTGIRQSVTDLEAMMVLLDTPPDVCDRPDAAALEVTGGHVQFDRVTFAYDPRRTVLDGVSFEIPPGHTVALVGPSGGGKSTVARLLFRFYDVTGGSITLDGQDLRDVTQDSLRRSIGVVPQDTVLFNDTLEANIAVGRAVAGAEDVAAALKVARLDGLVARLPDGLQTRVGERGLKLSGGEKQRVAIARLALKRPAVLVFDEATSALDSHTERDIQQNLREVAAERSTLVIAHRLSTVVDADEILYLDGGRIVERGRHEELLARDGAYAALWARQRRSEAAEHEATGISAVGG